MAIIIKSTSDSDSEIDAFIFALQEAIKMLDTLGQMQALAGGLSMEDRANDTFNLHAQLDNYLSQIEHNRKK